MLQRRGVKRLIFSGDSLMREIYHMVVQLLSHEFETDVPCAALPKEHYLLKTRNGMCNRAGGLAFGTSQKKRETSAGLDAYGSNAV